MKKQPDEKLIGDKLYWSPAKAADYIGLSKYSVLHFARTKRLTSLEMAGAKWFLKEWLDIFINRSTVLGNRG